MRRRGRRVAPTPLERMVRFLNDMRKESETLSKHMLLNNVCNFANAQALQALLSLEGDSALAVWLEDSYQQTQTKESLELLQSFSVLLGRLPLQNDLEKSRDTPLRPLLLRMTEDSQLPEGLKHQFAEVLRLWDSTPKGKNISQSTDEVISGTELTAELEAGDVDEPLHKKQRTERRGIHWASNDRLEQIKLFFVERDERRPRKKSRLRNTHQLVQADISWDTPPRLKLEAKFVYARGQRSQEKGAQQKRENDLIEVVYFQRESIPAHPQAMSPEAANEPSNNDDQVTIVDLLNFVVPPRKESAAEAAGSTKPTAAAAETESAAATAKIGHDMAAGSAAASLAASAPVVSTATAAAVAMASSSIGVDRTRYLDRQRRDWEREMERQREAERARDWHAQWESQQRVRQDWNEAHGRDRQRKRGRELSSTPLYTNAAYYGTGRRASDERAADKPAATAAAATAVSTASLPDNALLSQLSRLNNILDGSTNVPRERDWTRGSAPWNGSASAYSPERSAPYYSNPGPWQQAAAATSAVADEAWQQARFGSRELSQQQQQHNRAYQQRHSSPPFHEDEWHRGGASDRRRFRDAEHAGKAWGAGRDPGRGQHRKRGRGDVYVRGPAWNRGGGGGGGDADDGRRGRAVLPSPGDANYRTVRCNYFNSKSGCQKGDTCTFLHERPERQR